MPEPYLLRPIGAVHSPHRQPRGTPIQSGTDETRAMVEVEAEYVEGLADLEGFERIWLLSWFHRAAGFDLKVIPFMDTEKRGLFSTRAPRRPNPIGLSLVRLAAVRGNTVDIVGCDLLDGTPVLDIKPYAPQFDAFPDSPAGWLARKEPDKTRADDRFRRPT